MPLLYFYGSQQTNVNSHAPVGADASVRPAARACEHECTNAKS